MGLVIQSLRKMILAAPRIPRLVDACRLYCDGELFEQNSDIHTNGELRLLKELAPQLHIVMDVGANEGQWTQGILPLVPPDARIHAFEPSRAAFARLTGRGFPASVSLHNVALSSAPGSAELFIFGDGSELNSLHNRSGLDSRGVPPAASAERVTLTTVDEFRKQHGVGVVDFLKVDTEGHEVDVLLGAAGSLKDGSVRRIQFEYGGTYIDSHRLLKDVFELLTPLSYSIFAIRPERLTFHPRYDQALENFQYKNFVALHTSAIEQTPSALQATRHPY